MKNSIIIVAVLGLISCNLSAQCEKEITIVKVEDFYKNYLSASLLEWPRSQEVEDSLQVVFCSDSLLDLIELYNENYEGIHIHDLLTNDFGASSCSIESLVVSVEKSDYCVFKVSYLLTLTDVSGLDYVDRVHFFVRVNSVDEKLKIEDVW